LRSAGRTERLSRTGRVRDFAEVRAARAARAKAERAELEAAWSMLETGGKIRLSHFGRLDHALCFGRFTPRHGLTEISRSSIASSQATRNCRTGPSPGCSGSLRHRSTAAVAKRAD
jgi:hypothetical protein